MKYQHKLTDERPEDAHFADQSLQLRKELFKRFHRQGKFVLGCTDDANDCFTELLKEFHADYSTIPPQNPNFVIPEWKKK